MDGKRSGLRPGFISRRGVKRKTTPSSTIPNGIEGRSYLEASAEARHTALDDLPPNPGGPPWKAEPRAGLWMARLGPAYRACQPLKLDRRSSQSLMSRTRCRHASEILSSCSWIRSQEPLSIVLCCADHVSMRCRRRCVRNQRGTFLSVQSWGERKVFESGLKVIDHSNSLRAQSGGSSSMSCPTDQPMFIRTRTVL